MKLLAKLVSIYFFYLNNIHKLEILIELEVEKLDKLISNSRFKKIIKPKMMLIQSIRIN